MLGTARSCSEVFGGARGCSELLGAARNCSQLLGTARRCSEVLGAALVIVTLLGLGIVAGQWWSIPPPQTPCFYGYGLTVAFQVWNSFEKEMCLWTCWMFGDFKQ